MKKIASFSVDHDLIVPGIYISRVDGDIVTYDLRTRIPNSGDLMSNSAMHSVEHMFATFLRNSRIGPNVIYFGPMGCQTGFYLLVRGEDHTAVISVIIETLNNIIAYDGPVFGASRKECGNFSNLNLEEAKAEARRYLEDVSNWTTEKLAYPEA